MIHRPMSLSLFQIKVNQNVTLKVQYRSSVINANLIQNHSSVFVTWSSLNKSYIGNYTLHPDHISLKKQEEHFLSLYLTFCCFSLKWSSPQMSHFIFLYWICPAKASSENNTCNNHIPVPLTTHVSSSFFFTLSPCLSNFKLPPHLSFLTSHPPTHCHTIYLFVSLSQLLSRLLSSLAFFPCLFLLVILSYLTTTNW